MSQISAKSVTHVAASRLNNFPAWSTPPPPRRERLLSAAGAATAVAIVPAPSDLRRVVAPSGQEPHGGDDDQDHEVDHRRGGRVAAPVGGEPRVVDVLDDRTR